MLALTILMIHLSSLKSFGIPYLSPIGTLQKNRMQDTIFRFPLWKMDKRPHLSGGYNTYRQSNHLKPGPNQKED